jgi:hypothetical protein
MLLPGSTEFEGLIGGDNFLNHTVETLKDSPSASLIAFGPRQLNWTSLNGEAYLQFRFSFIDRSTMPNSDLVRYMYACREMSLVTFISSIRPHQTVQYRRKHYFSIVLACGPTSSHSFLNGFILHYFSIVLACGPTSSYSFLNGFILHYFSIVLACGPTSSYSFLNGFILHYFSIVLACGPTSSYSFLNGFILHYFSIVLACGPTSSHSFLNGFILHCIFQASSF